MRDARDLQLRLHGAEARVALSVLIPVQLHRTLKVTAAERGTSVAKLVSEVLAEAMHENDEPPSAAQEGRMFGWVKRRGATAAELQQQLDAALREHADHEEAIADAQDDFDASGADAAARKLTDMRAVGLALLEHVERARRLLEEAQKAEAEAERLAMEERVAEIEARLSLESVQELVRPVDAREAQLLMNLASLRDDRVKLAQQLNGVGRERAGLLERLGRPPAQGIVVEGGRAVIHRDPFADRGNAALHENGVREVLARKLGELDESDPRVEHGRKILADMGNNLPPQHASAGLNARATEGSGTAAPVALAGRKGAA